MSKLTALALALFALALTACSGDMITAPGPNALAREYIGYWAISGHYQANPDFLGFTKKPMDGCDDTGFMVITAGTSALNMYYFGGSQCPNADNNGGRFSVGRLGFDGVGIFYSVELPKPDGVAKMDSITFFGSLVDGRLTGLSTLTQGPRIVGKWQGIRLVPDTVQKLALNAEFSRRFPTFQPPP